MEINEIATFTTSTCPPPGKRKKITTRKAISTLPNYTAHVQVQDHIFVASNDGDVSYFLPEEPRSPNYIGSHDGSIHCLIYHSIWKLLISASVDGVIKMWDPFNHYSQPKESQNRCIQVLQAHNHAILTLAPHGDIFLSGSVDKTLKVWKVDYDRLKFGFNPWFNQIGRSIELDGWVTALWASDIPLVSAVADIIVGDSTGRVYTLKSTCQMNEPLNIIGVKCVKSVQKLKKQGIVFLTMILTHNLQIISTTHNQLRISDSQGNMKFCTLENERSTNYKHVAWNPNREEMILLDGSGTLEIYDYRADRILLTQFVQPDTKWISFNHYAEEILISGRYGCQLWKITRNTPFKLYSGHEAPIIGLFSYTIAENDLPQPLQSELSSRPSTASNIESESDALSVFSESTSIVPSEAKSYTTAYSSQYSTLYTSNDSTHTDDGQYKDKIIVSCGQDSRILLWTYDQFSMKNFQSIEEENGEIFCATFIPAMKVVVTGHDTGEIAFQTLQPNYSERKLYLKVHSNTVSCIQYVEFDRRRGPEDSRKYIVTGGFDGKLGMCNITNYMRQYQAPYYEFVRQCYSCTIMCIIENPISDTIITGASDGVIKIWNNRLNLESTLTAHKLGVTSLSLDGYFLFSSCEDSEVIMWDTLSGVQLKSFSIHSSPLNILKIQPQTGNIVSADSGGKIIVWSYTDANIIFEYNRRNTDFTCLFVEDSEKEIFAGTDEGSLLRIKVAVDEYEAPVKFHESSESKSHILNGSDGLPDPIVTPRLSIRCPKEKHSYDIGRDIDLEERVRAKLENSLDDDEALNGVFI